MFVSFEKSDRRSGIYMLHSRFNGAINWAVRFRVSEAKNTGEEKREAGPRYEGEENAGNRFYTDADDGICS